MREREPVPSLINLNGQRHEVVMVSYSDGTTQNFGVEKLIKSPISGNQENLWGEDERPEPNEHEEGEEYSEIIFRDPRFMGNITFERNSYGHPTSDWKPKVY